MKPDEWDKARREQDDALARRHSERTRIGSVEFVQYTGRMTYADYLKSETRQAWCIWCGKPMLLPREEKMDRLCDDCVK